MLPPAGLRFYADRHPPPEYVARCSWTERWARIGAGPAGARLQARSRHAGRLHGRSVRQPNERHQNALTVPNVPWVRIWPPHRRGRYPQERRGHGTGGGGRPREDRPLLTIDAKAPGRRRPLIPQWQIPLPPDPTGRAEPLTLRALISRIVASEVAAFRERQETRNLVRVLSAQEIDEGAARGKVESGGRQLHQEVNEGQAIGTALQAFEDGLYLVILDGREQRNLDEQIFPGPDSHLTFLRLVMLAGA
jgi:hypothetical protein